MLTSLFLISHGRGLSPPVYVQKLSPSTKIERVRASLMVIECYGNKDVHVTEPITLACIPLSSQKWRGEATPANAATLVILLLVFLLQL